MEGAEIYIGGASFRRGSSSIWRSNAMDTFSKSSREEDDEEALKWAALERLPTYDRLKKGILTTSKGEASEIAVANLGFLERRTLVDRLVKVAEEDNERVGIELPTIEVRFEHLNIETEAHVGSRALPTFINFSVDIVEGFLNNLHILPSRKKRLSILQDISGIIKPRRMTLLLGPPSSGKTTLLLALAGKLDPKLKFSGRVTYNGHGMNEFVPQRTAAYISQYDTHIGEMTVRETLAFSARCHGVGHRYEMLTELIRREKASNIKPDSDLDVFMKAIATEGQETSVITDYILKVLGLEVCADIMVGNEMLRGVSGGQRKRVTTGQIVYQGPREHVLEFFEFMGFKCPERKGVADFLQEVTSRKDQQQYWILKDQPYCYVTVKEFSEAFQSFHVGRDLENELSTPFDKTKSHPAALTTKKYGVGKMELLKACFSREILLMKRNSFVYIFKLTQLAIMAMIAMTLFLRTEMHRDSVTDGGIYVGALFFSVVFIMFNGLSEISMTISKLPVFYKQRNLLFYPAWAYSLPPWIIKIPITLIQVALWVFLTYYVIGYDPNVGRLFRQYLLLVLVGQMASALFRFIAAAGRNMIVANTFGSFALLTLFALGGFILSRERIVVNEFFGKSWSRVLPSSTEPLGIEVLQSRGFFTNAYWYWIGVGALAGFTLLYNLCFTLALTFLGPLQKPQAVISDGSPSNESGSGHQTPTESWRGSSSVKAEVIVSGNHQNKKGMVLPFEPNFITFDEIRYSVDMPQARCFTALMGVSGAGKTTLMDVLAGRKTGGYIEGNIKISGYPKKQESFARISGYCEQNDIHSPHVTVYESLLYSAWLRLPPDVSSETRKMFIEEVMQLVELEPLRQALVGLPGVSGLSTEQRKRLTIAVELVANPSIIFMDEPTSGLDARAAAIVMRTVRNTVDTGRTVVCTIHQPSIDIFEAFDELFLMKRGGQEIYVGPLGRHSCHLIKYFEGIEGVPNIKDGYNPATWMLEVTSSAQELVLGVDFAAIYRNSELYRRNKALIEELSMPGPESKDLYFPTKYSQTFFTQCMACLWKQHWSYWRNPPYTAVRLLFTTVIALMFGTMFWDLGSKTTKRQDLFNAMGSMYAAIVFLGIQNASSVQPVVAVERSVFYRERAAGMYSALPYAFAQVLIELPYIFVQSVVYGLIVYAMIGFEWSAAKFFWYLFFMYFTLLYYTFYGMMSVAATPNQHVASIVSSAFYSLWNLFSGFIIPRPRIPVWWRWYAWACPVAYTLYGLISSQFGDVKDRLESGERVEDFLRSYFGFKHELLGAVAAAVVGFAALFAFIFAICIKFFNYQRR
ncbi:hypothetical protein GH714_025374 [Hevea brasiliensis]|uniref:ABC transporter domain-containing protein n=1 Tax=Hevea brasiliensis TaxID=3981 RepID=A0A6A6LM45_HEVBR|nr:hypothetical protein GH714_025374 [Hevea brasiliensis]